MANREQSQLAGLSEFREALSQAKLLTTSANEHLKKHEPDAALVDPRVALQSLKDNPLAFYLTGVAWEQKGDAPQAQRNLKAARALQPDYPPALNDLGLILGQEGNRTGAMEEWDQAVALTPDYAETHYNRVWRACACRTCNAPCKNSTKRLL